MTDYTKYKQDNFFGFQVQWPVFVKRSFNMFGKEWKTGEEFNWLEWPSKEADLHNIKVKVKLLYDTGRLHHDSSREVEQKVGDRLGELNSEKLLSLVRQINAITKDRTTTDKEFQDKRLKQSKLADKQRGLIRAWLNRNNWALDDYMRIRDNLLDN